MRTTPSPLVDWQQLEKDWSAWWAGELGRPLVMIRRLDPEAKLPEVSRFLPYRSDHLSAEELVALHAPLVEAQRCYGDAFPQWFVNFGPGIIAGFLGSRVIPREDTVWFEPAEILEPAGMDLPYNADNAWWKRVQEVTTAAAERFAGLASVSYTDLGGNLDILASLRGSQALLTDLIDCPDEIERLVGQITQHWLRYFESLHGLTEPADTGHSPWAPIWSPKRTYMLQCDFCYMISPAMFERFVLPDLDACCRQIDHALYHLDGPGALTHLDMLCAIEDLQGIQWIPGAGQKPPDEWPEVLATIRRAGKLCQVSVSPKGAERIVREHGGKGFALMVGTDMPESQIPDFLDSLRRAGR